MIHAWLIRQVKLRWDVLVTGIGVIYAIIWSATDVYHQQLLLLFELYVFVALALYVPFILGGALSFAYTAYIAIGAYSVAELSVRGHLNLILALPLGVAIGAAVAVVLGMATIRLSGFFLAAVTILFVFAFQDFLLDAVGITGGAAGLGPIRGIDFGNASFNSETYIGLGLVVAWLIGLGVNNLRQRSVGLVLQACREVPDAVEALGIRVPMITLVALGGGAAIAAIGGTFYALANRTVLPDGFPLDIVIIGLFAPLLGGARTAWGVFVGSAIVVEFTYNLQFFSSTGTLLFCIGIVLVELLFPKGLLGYQRELRHSAGRARTLIARWRV